jgi:hypothetical protein
MANDVAHIIVFLFVHLGIILILVFGFYSGVSDRARTEDLFSLCVVSLLSRTFTASALVWFSYVFDIPLLYFTEHCVHLYIFMDPVGVYVPRCVQNG